MSQERTRFPITPQDRHRTAQSFDDVQAVPEENIPHREERPQDKPLPPTRDADDDERDDAEHDEDDEDSAQDEHDEDVEHDEHDEDDS